MRLKELRIEKGVLQKDIAAEINVTTAMMGDWERQRTEPNITALCKLADYFQCTVDYLIGREADTGIIELKGYQLQEHEKTLLDFWKKLTEDNQIRALGYMTKLLHQQ